MLPVACHLSPAHGMRSGAPPAPLNDLLDGDPDLEPEHHDGEASFPSSPLHAITDPLALDGGPGDLQDVEVDDELEDDNEDRGLDGS